MDKALPTFCSLLVITSNGVDGHPFIFTRADLHVIYPHKNVYIYTTYHVVNIQLKMAS